MALQRSNILLSTPPPAEHGFYKGPHTWYEVIDALPPFKVEQDFIHSAARSAEPGSREVSVSFYGEKMYAGGLIERVRRWGLAGIFNSYLSRVVLSTTMEVPRDDSRDAVLPSSADNAASRAALDGAFLRLEALTRPDPNEALKAMVPENHIVNPPPFNQRTESW